VNNTQQFRDDLRCKRGSGFALTNDTQTSHSSVFHKMQIRKMFVINTFHLYDFCRKFVPSAGFFVARPKKRQTNALCSVTIGRLSPRG